MKKLSILLAILMLAGVMPVGCVSALVGGGEVNETEDIQVESERGIEVEDGRKMVLPVVHELDQRIHIQVIRPREGAVDIEVGSPLGAEWQLQRIWLATFDYENGWTETEVDALLDEWTTLEAEWVKVTKEQVFQNMGLHAYATIPLTIGTSRAQHDLTQVNLADVLYYAAEFKDLADDDAEPMWVRGKVDYRGCVHSQRFEEWATGSCEEVVDWQARTTVYLAAGETEAEEVISWGEEWKRVLGARLDEIGLVLDGIGVLLEVPEEILEQEEEKLAKIEELLVKVDAAEGELEKVETLRERIEALRQGNDSDLVEPGDDLVGDLEAGDTEIGENELGGGDAFGGAGLEVGESSGVMDGIENRIIGVVGSTANVQDADGATSEVTDNDMSEADSSIEEDMIEVPRLGGTEERSGWIWGLAAAVAGMLSLLSVVVLKRKQGEDRQR